MMRFHSKLAFVTAAILGAALFVSAAQEQIAGRHVEQTSFSSDLPLDYDVPIPREVVKLLLHTKEARQASQDKAATQAQRDNPTKFFQASAIQLASADETDLVVVGVHPMSGGDNGWFWVVRSFPKDPKILLFVGARSLEIMEQKTNGCRDIRVVSASAGETTAVTYHFDGQAYKVWKKQSTPADQ
jgi:hypothetical protein